MASLRSPSRSAAASPIPRPSFDADLLKNYTKALLSTTLQTAAWPDAKDRDKVKGWMKEIGERVKTRMLEIRPTGFKYIVMTQINENLGQGGRADMVCHWEDSDIVVQEMFSNDSLICICVAFAIRTM
ncbi:hypothetical protein MIND_00706600 [Mycena indigotica]|uniref:Topoisomerase I damage affected protein 2 n=1 Tax=Mycena indigotica TaxID=2126181 RepID=A0A8H6W4F8_9AGAR|nr:uncharacterized protein MIND_00706600 [Mycena indigotica]KAF7301413.1 hypothetical protein MIND_00706600 [Mycena indigotica]